MLKVRNYCCYCSWFNLVFILVTSMESPKKIYQKVRTISIRLEFVNFSFFKFLFLIIFKLVLILNNYKFLNLIKILFMIFITFVMFFNDFYHFYSVWCLVRTRISYCFLDAAQCRSWKRSSGSPASAGSRCKQEDVWSYSRFTCCGEKKTTLFTTRQKSQAKRKRHLITMECFTPCMSCTNYNLRRTKIQRLFTFAVPCVFCQNVSGAP